MSDRLADDRAKLIEAVEFFRVSGNLHANSTDSALVGFAHGSGSTRPRADIVRDAWHDYEHGRRYAGLETARYIIARESQPEQNASGGGSGVVGSRGSSNVNAGPSSPRPKPAPDDDEVLF